MGGKAWSLDGGWVVEFASSESHILEAKALDDLAFAGHHGIAVEELEEIVQVGKLILLRHPETGELIGESQVLFRPLKGLPWHFDHPVAFCYGTAIRPDFQGHRLGKLLALEQERVARENGKTELQLTVRVENYASLRMRTGIGFEIWSYKEDFYGGNPDEDARLFMRKSFRGTFTARSIKEMVAVGFDGDRDPIAHRRIQEQLALGRLGIAVERSKGILFG